MAKKVGKYVRRWNRGRIRVKKSGEDVNSDTMSVPASETPQHLRCLTARNETTLFDVQLGKGLVDAYDEDDEIGEEGQGEGSEVRHEARGGRRHIVQVPRAAAELCHVPGRDKDACHPLTPLEGRKQVSKGQKRRSRGSGRGGWQRESERERISGLPAILRTPGFKDHRNIFDLHKPCTPRI